MNCQTKHLDNLMPVNWCPHLSTKKHSERAILASKVKIHHPSDQHKSISKTPQIHKNQANLIQLECLQITYRNTDFLRSLEKALKNTSLFHCKNLLLLKNKWPLLKLCKVWKHLILLNLKQWKMFLKTVNLNDRILVKNKKLKICWTLCFLNTKSLLD